MERLYGVPLTDLAAIRSITSADPEATLTAALNTWFGSLLGCSTFHADVHAGDLLHYVSITSSHMKIQMKLSGLLGSTSAAFLVLWSG